MKCQNFVIQILLTIAVLTIGNLAVHRLAANSIPRQILKKCSQGEPATDLFLGNSMMEAGIDEATYSRYAIGRRPRNAGLGYSEPVEHFLIYSKQGRHAGANVFYGFFDTQLTDRPSGEWNTLAGNRAMAYYVDLDLAITFYAPDDQIKAIQMRLLSKIPLVVERFSLWARIERVRRILGEIGFPPVRTNRFGRVNDFTMLEPESDKNFAVKCFQLAQYKVPLSSPLEAMMGLAKERGSQIFFVEMPLPSAHRQRFYNTAEWKLYRTHLKKIIGEAGGRYIQASDWVADEDFADSLHLNAAGAELFSRKLAQYADLK